MFLKEGNHEALKYIWALLVTESIPKLIIFIVKITVFGESDKLVASVMMIETKDQNEKLTQNRIQKHVHFSLHTAIV